MTTNQPPSDEELIAALFAMTDVLASAKPITEETILVAKTINYGVELIKAQKATLERVGEILNSVIKNQQNHGRYYLTTYKRKCTEALAAIKNGVK